jgi:hypothetical protein
MSNKNRFFPIFQNDGEPSTHTRSSPRSNKSAAKRARQGTPGPPHPPAAQTRLAILMLLRQLPNPQQPCLTGPSPPCTISFVTTAPTSRCSPQPSSAATPRSKSLTYASTRWNLSMMTSTLPPVPHLLRDHRRPEETGRCSHCPPCGCACSCSHSSHRTRFDFKPTGCYPRRSPLSYSCSCSYSCFGSRPCLAEEV